MSTENLLNLKVHKLANQDSYGTMQEKGELDLSAIYLVPEEDVADPTASGTSTTFIATASQTNGKIAVTKKTITSASTTNKGIVQLTDSTSSTSTTTAATPNSVKTINDRIDALDYSDPSVPTEGTTTATAFIESVSQTNGKISATKKELPVASSGVAGITKLGATGGAATYGHTHTTTLTNDSGTSVSTLTHGSTYKLTAGGTSVEFTMPTDADTHYKAYNYVGVADSMSNGATTNGSTYLKLYENSTKRSQFRVSGEGATTVASDANGNITISSTDTLVKQTAVTSWTDDYYLLASAVSSPTSGAAYEAKYNTNIKLNGSGQLTATSFCATSDKRLKENITPYSYEKSILDLPVYKYNFINDENKKEQIGCLAQDLQEICPEIVNEDSDGYLSIQESKLVYLLLKEVKKLKEEIIALKDGGR